eukprot:3685321-Prymnesium_polylepis.1
MHAARVCSANDRAEGDLNHMLGVFAPPMIWRVVAIPATRGVPLLRLWSADGDSNHAAISSPCAAPPSFWRGVPALIRQAPSAAAPAERADGRRHVFLLVPVAERQRCAARGSTEGARPNMACSHPTPPTAQ